MRIKKIIGLIGCFTYSIVGFSQQKLVVHEVGFSANLNLDYGLLYKTGKPNSLFRLKTLFFTGEISNSAGLTESAYGVGFSLGTEFRKKIIGELAFVYGFDLGLNYNITSYNNQIDPEQLTLIISPNVNLVLGLNYILKEHWVFSVELMPYLSYDIQSIYADLKELKKFATIHYGLSLSYVQFGVAYRFNKSK